ncbi:MAG: methionine synthase [Candidatus Firestonebacteria bacterium RIFOXYC2_FULL_39_67]|nr:MAG: methionine synthase [Candidatus Firestonebacteria bacterium RIFOXYC2_FULL_39_67]
MVFSFWGLWLKSNRIKKERTMLGATIGDCVHVAGILKFLSLAETEGYKIVFFGVAVSVDCLIESIMKQKPDVVAISYRLTPGTAQKVFNELKKKSKGLKIRFIFGGTKPVAEVASKSHVFSKIFTGDESIQEIRCYLRGVGENKTDKIFADNLISRIESLSPYPLIRHHFGRPTLRETINGAKLIAESKVIDVLSLGPDQNAQEYIFHPEKMDKGQNGAGGVPLRKPEDLKAIYNATRCGNYPLVRCYAGTNDLIKWAKMSVATIHNAWGAIPLFWYSVLDGRSSRNMIETIEGNQDAIRWYAKRNIPVEVNESHQWSLRDAHDSLAVALAFLAAYNAKVLGVKHYVSQYMFNTPAGTSPRMDLAKMLAKKEMIESLSGKNFKVYTEVRAGLNSFSSDMDIAKGQLPASGVLSLALKPHIFHVVGFSEGHHAIKAEELIESCNIIHGMLRNTLTDFPDLTIDPLVQKRKKELIKESGLILKALKSLQQNKKKDAYIDSFALSSAVRIGLFDAPHLKGNSYAKGNINTQILNGRCVVCDVKTNREIKEKERIEKIFIGEGKCVE